MPDASRCPCRSLLMSDDIWIWDAVDRNWYRWNGAGLTRLDGSPDTVQVCPKHPSGIRVPSEEGSDA